MTFLRLLGWPLRVPEGGLQGELRHHGESARAWTNRRLRDRSALLTTLRLAANLLERDHADVLECLAAGQGHAWTFAEHAFSSQGAGPEASSVYSLGRGGAFPNGGHLLLGIGGSVVWDLELDREWIAFYWRGAASAQLARFVAVRSDGAKWLGLERDDSLATPELVVSGGALALAQNGSYAGLAVLPCAPPDDVVEAFAEWVTGGMLLAYWPLDDTSGAELVGAYEGTAAGTVAKTDGQVGGGAVTFNGQGFALSAFVGNALSGGYPAITVAFWIRASPTGANNVVIHTTVSSFVIPPPVGLRVYLDAEGLLVVQARPSNVGALRTHETGILVATGEWRHVVCVIDVAGKTMRAHVDADEEAAQAAAFEVTTWATGGNKGNRLGGDGTAPLVADLDDVRLYGKAFDAADVLEDYERGLAGKRAPLRRQWPAFPALVVDGDALGGDELEVVGQVDDQGYRQRGATSRGWENAARDVNVTLDQRRAAPSRERIPEPSILFVLDAGHVQGDTLEALRPSPVHGGAIGASLVRERAGPYQRGQAFGFPGTWSAAGVVTLPDALSDLFARQRKASVAVWATREGASTSGSLLSFASDSKTAKLALYITGRRLRMAAESNLADAPQIAEGGTLVPEDGAWHLFGGTVDLANARVEAWLDAVKDGELVDAVFGEPRWSDEVGAGASVIGGMPGGSAPIVTHNGRIAMVAVWLGRVLEAADWRRLYRLGRAGVFY